MVIAGGGGSGYGSTNTAGSGRTPANTSDTDYAGSAGYGGSSVLNNEGINGNDGNVVIIY